MIICLYGTGRDESELNTLLLSMPEYAYRKIEFDLYESYEGYIKGLQEKVYDAVIVAEDGANGMEGVIAAGSVKKDIPVMWLSDDKGFLAQSFRLGAAYFHQKPISAETLSQALKQCQGKRKAD